MNIVLESFDEEEDLQRFAVLKTEVLRVRSVRIETFASEAPPHDLNVYLRPDAAACPFFIGVLPPDVTNLEITTAIEEWCRRTWPGTPLPAFEQADLRTSGRADDRSPA